MEVGRFLAGAKGQAGSRWKVKGLSGSVWVVGRSTIDDERASVARVPLTDEYLYLRVP